MRNADGSHVVGKSLVGGNVQEGRETRLARFMTAGFEGRRLRRCVCGWRQFPSCVLVALLLAIPAIAAEPKRVPDFCFIQISDIHISPVPAGAKPGKNGSDAGLAFFCQEGCKPQTLVPYDNLVTPKPAFALATGDITEFGVIGSTFSVFENLVKPFGADIYIIPGNHDNTWTSMLSLMRERHGSDNYSFDQFGCHFIGIDTAGPQEPLPVIEERTLNFLANDLKKVSPDQPIFLFGHHPLSSTEFVSAYEKLRLIEALRGYNVVLYLMGHGHCPVTEQWGGLDAVEGGSTFGGNTGYSIISVNNGVLRVAYRFMDASQPMKPLLEKSILPKPQPVVEVLKPAAGGIVSGQNVAVAVRVDGPSPKSITATIDGTKEQTITLKKQGKNFAGEIKAEKMLAGAHYLHVTASYEGRDIDEAIEFLLTTQGQGIREQRLYLPAGVKAQPVLVDDHIWVATTDGELYKLPLSGRSTELPRPVFATAGEILHPPALVDGVFYFGAGDGTVHAVALTGEKKWSCPIGSPAYGTPAVTADGVFVGDLAGKVHGIDRETGKIRWSKQVATYSIESPLTVHDGTIYVGAWDALYAVNVADGAVKWRQLGPVGQKDEAKFKSRYYAPADCGPVVVGDRVFVVDRGYCFGSYDFNGKYLGEISGDIAAIGRTADGAGVYARGLSKGVSRYDREGKKLWSADVDTGRFPLSPTETDGVVYACSNRGCLSAIDAAKGTVLWQYQAIPQTTVMAAVAADKSAIVVAGMDGNVVLISRP